MKNMESRLPLSAYPVLRATAPRVALETAVMFSDTRSFEPLYVSDPFKLVINSTAIAGVRLGAVASTGHKVEVFDRDYLTGIIPLSGWARVETEQGEFQASPGKMLLTGTYHRSTAVSREYSAMTFQIPRHGHLAASKASAALANATKTVSQPHQSGSLGPLFEFVQFLVQQVGKPASLPTASQLQIASESLLAELALRAFRTNPFDSDDELRLPAAPWQAELAAAYLRSKFREPLAIAEVAAAAGTGTRALQLAFKKRFGIAPRRFLEDLRLAHMRDLLRSANPGQTVTRLALDSGFTHLGRFSRSYFERYGEHPFRTLAKAGNAVVTTDKQRFPSRPSRHQP